MKFSHSALALVIAALLTASASAHVYLLSPTGGEELPSGGSFLIEWEVALSHDTVGWELYYSITGAEGEFIPIALDIPPGDIAKGTIHSYSWTIPSSFEVGSNVWVKVIQDNVEYHDQSDMSLKPAIVVANPCPGDFNDDTIVDGADLGLALSAWGTANNDLNEDGIFDGADLGLFLSLWGDCPGP